MTQRSAGGSAGFAQPVADRAMAAVATLMIVVAAYLLFFGGHVEDGLASGASAPKLALLTPAGQELAGETIRLEFTSSEPLARGPGGWEAGGYHLHASLGGQELMPAAESIQRFGGSRYLWTIQAPEQSAQLRLFWSDSQHLRIPGTETEVRTISIR